MRKFRIFIASPGDVSEEREIAREIISRVASERAFRDELAIQAVAWDQPGMAVAMDATMTPQEAIEKGLPKPSECDLTIVILWSRIGTVLPESYLKTDGTRYRSGTEWEYLDAVAGTRKNSQSAVWIYRREEVPSVQIDDPDADDKKFQWQSVNKFLEELENPDKSIKGGINSYETPDEFAIQFEALLRDHLVGLVNNAQPPSTADAEQRLIQHSAPNTVLGLFAGALKLDRSEQWTGLIEAMSNDKDALLLLHGEKRENLEYFIARLWYYLSYENSTPSELIEIPLKDRFVIPASPAAWENHIGSALNESGTVTEILTAKLRRSPVLLVFCRRPVKSTDFSDETEMQAFERFFENRILTIMKGVTSSPVVKYPLRVLLTIEYDFGEDWVERYHIKLKSAYQEAPVQYIRLPRVSQVEWSHIQTYLDKLDPSPSFELIQKMENLYESLDKDTMTFRDLADLLNEQIH